SSMFDFITFFIMLFVFNATAPLFQTAWFIESLSTQTLVIFAVRTTKTPFYKSKPSKPLLFSTISVVIFSLILPFTPIGSLFGLVQPPLTFYLILGLLIASYFTIVELAKKWFYKKYPID